MKWQDSIIVVTGGISGLGAASVQRLSKAGAYVAVVDLQLPSDAKAAGSPRLKYFKADITETKEVETAVNGIILWSKEVKRNITSVVCCAGYLGPAKILSKDGTAVALDKITKVVNASLIGTIDIIRQLLPTIAAQDPDSEGSRGVLITVSSAAAFDGQEGQVAYSAAKGAIASMTLPLARDLSSRGIRAVCISPGLFGTAMTQNMPKKAQLSLERTLEYPARAGKPEEFAGLVEHILENDMLNGTVIRLDGAARMPSRL